VVDLDGDEVVPGSGVVGQVLAGGHLPVGYYNDPERTAATFVTRPDGRWLITGDMATIGADGAIELLGRARAPSTPAARRSSPRRSRASSRRTRRCTTAWWSAWRTTAGAAR
jgi:acyl-CoA synthetase (AMP-forming)/AMP-acid ligase II